ncbi:MAG: restriction endonuclease subunit S [Methanothrix sp.]|nr:restriction endonuclease subunit S [Methanothrix sp.]
MNCDLTVVQLKDIMVPIERPENPIPGKIYRQLGVKLWGEGAYERESIDGGQTKYKTLSSVQENDIVVNKIWARNGTVAVVSESLSGCFVSGEFPTFTPIQDVLMPRWFHWLTKTKVFWRQCDEKSQGTSGKNRIRPEKFLEIQIPLPTIVEQHRIVARIEELAARIEEARELRRRAVEEAEALFNAYYKNLFGEIPLDGHLGDVLLGKPRNGWSAKCDNEENGIPVLTLSAVTGFQYRENEIKKTSEKTSVDGNYWLKVGDLLITRSNTPDLVGHAAIYSGSPAPCIYPDLMMRLEVDGKQAIKKFVHSWLKGPAVRQYIRRVSKGTSPTMKKINQQAVMNIPFPIRFSIQEQLRIVAQLDALQAKLDALKRHQAETAAKLDALLPALLERAFRGDL